MGKSEKVEINALTKRKAEKLWVDPKAFSGGPKLWTKFSKETFENGGLRRGFPNMGKSSASEEE